MIDGEHAFKSASAFGSRTDRARCPDQSLAEISRSELSKALRGAKLRARGPILGFGPISQTFGRWVNLGATWAQNPPFMCPNKVFDECKAN